MDRAMSTADMLQQRGQIKPYVAKRHLHHTGTLRYLVPWVVDLAALEEVRQRSFGEADGAVVFVLTPMGLRPSEAVDEVAAFSLAISEPRRTQTLFAIPRHTRGIREAFEEVMAWEWVGEHTPELEGDSVARRELGARQAAAGSRLERAVGHCFDVASSYGSAEWVWSGQRRTFASARGLASALSDVCDAAYAEAPVVKNELINRRSLSSAAAAARRSLVERMLTHGAEERLGLEGYPPEASMYLSVLAASGLHGQRGHGWGFGPPADEDPCAVLPLWRGSMPCWARQRQHGRPVLVAGVGASPRAPRLE